MGTVLNVTISWHGTTVTILQSQVPAPNVIPLCMTTFSVPNVIIMIGLILVTAPNAVRWLSLYFYFVLVLVKTPNTFPDSLFINSLCPRWVWKFHRKGMTQFIQNFFCRLGWSVGIKLPQCWQLKDKKNSQSTMNNHL